MDVLLVILAAALLIMGNSTWAAYILLTYVVVSMVFAIFFGEQGWLKN